MKLHQLQRRELIALLAGTTVLNPLTVGTLPLFGFIRSRGKLPKVCSTPAFSRTKFWRYSTQL
jgi:hypothetical protein